MAVSASLAIRSLFAPWDDTTGEFLAFVNGAQQSLHINIYGFHLPRLTDALIAKHQAGLEVSIILDHTQEEGKAEQGEVQRLLNAGVPLLVGTSPVHRQILHGKWTVVDGKAVSHGSWNYSLSASQQLNDLHFVSDEAYAREYLKRHDAIRAFILLHEMTLQPAREVPAPAALPEDAATPAAAPAAAPAVDQPVARPAA